MKKIISMSIFTFLVVLCFFQWTTIQFIDHDILLWGGKNFYFNYYLLIFTTLILIIMGVIYKVRINKCWIKGVLITQILMFIYLFVNYLYIIWFKTLTEEYIYFHYSHLEGKQPPPDSWVIISIIANLVLIIFLLIQKKKIK